MYAHTHIVHHSRPTVSQNISYGIFFAAAAAAAAAYAIVRDTIITLNIGNTVKRKESKGDEEKERETNKILERNSQRRQAIEQSTNKVNKY